MIDFLKTWLMLLTVMALVAVTYTLLESLQGPSKPEDSLICLFGRQYVRFHAPEPCLAMVLTRRGERFVVASCGEGTPADVAEMVERLGRALDAMPLERPEREEKK